MNTKFIASAVISFSALTGASAFAQTHLYGEAALAIGPNGSTTSMSAVPMAYDNLNARQNGEVLLNQQTTADQRQPAMGMSRAQVRSEAEMAARMNRGGRSAI